MARGKHEKRRGARGAGTGTALLERGRKSKRAKKAERKIPRPLTAIMSLAVIFVLCWTAFVYSPTPVLTKWRENLISTAMSTFKHQWIATYLIPQNVIDDVMLRAAQEQEGNKIDRADAPPGQTEKGDTNASGEIGEGGEGGEGGGGEQQQSGTEIIPDTGNTLVDEFLEEYYQIDPATLPDDFDTWGLPNIKVKNIADKGILTTQGDRVWAIDTINGILIVEIKGETSDGRYEGKLAIIKDSSQTMMAVVPSGNDYGYTVRRFLEKNNGIIGINANPFVDSKGDGTTGNGTGNLEHAIGLIVSNGRVAHKKYGEEAYQMGGFDYDDNFLVGTKLDPKELRDAGEFKPVLVANGESRIFTSSSFGMGIQPRSAIGQTDKKETLMLIIDGRNATGLGTTVAEAAKVLVRYNCWNALGNDGGSSAVMVYDGEVITNCSAVSAEGRYLPCAWIVKAKG